MDDELLTVKEVAARLKVNPQTVRRWIRAGRLPAVRIAARGYRVRAEDLARRVFVPAPEPTPEQLERRGKAFEGLFAIRERAAEQSGLAVPSLQEILDENRFELETRGEQIRRPPLLTPEEVARARAAFAEIRRLRSRFSGSGPSLQELLDERRRELED